MLRIVSPELRAQNNAPQGQQRHESDGAGEEAAVTVVKANHRHRQT